MADTSETTYISELLVPLSALMAANGEDPNEMLSYGEIYDAANYYGIGMSENDHQWWQKNQHQRIESSEKKDVVERAILAGKHLLYSFYNGQLPTFEAELVGRDNDNFPPDFRIGDDLFSLKDNSNILWNTTPKALFPYIKPDIAEAIEKGDIQYLQGCSMYNQDGSLKKKQPAYDWFLYADHDLCQNNYRNLLWSLFRLFYDIKMWKQPEWNPNCGEGEWWKIDEEYGDVLPVTGDTQVRGAGAIPFDTPERIVFSNSFAGHYEVYLYDGFDEESYPVTFLGLRNTESQGSVGIIPIVFYDEDMYAYPYFDGNVGMGMIQVEDVLNRSDFADNEEYIPFYNFSVKKSGKTAPLTQGVAKTLSRFITQSPYSPANSVKEYAAFYEPDVPSSVPRPIFTFDSMQIEFPPDTLMTELEYWLTRLRIAASDSLAFCVEDILAADTIELVSLLTRIYDTPYYYMRMYNDGPVIYRVPSIDEISDVYINDISFDSDQKNTMMIVQCGTNEASVDLRIEFRNKGGYFAGAPDMMVLYDEKTSDLSGIYQRIL